MRKRIGVVADDVTGANDIGIMFQKGGYRSAVFPLSLLPLCSIAEEAEGLDVIIIDTDSRFDTPGIAREKVRRATELLETLPCDVYFNKTCSVFRGNIGAEFDEMQDVLGVGCCMVVLGFPANGRTTVDGIHYVYGKKLEESQFRNDPIHPMTISSLEEILHRQSDRSVRHITWRDLDRGAAWVKARKDELKTQCAYLIFDIRDQRDLRIVAQAIADERCICGSSAIGEELPAAYEQKEEEQVLILAGSLTQQSLAQIAYMKQQNCPAWEFPADCIYDETKRQETIAGLTGEMAEALTKNRICLLHSSNQAESVKQTKECGKALGLTDEEIGKRISETMCTIVRAVLERSGCRRLIVAGGDTSAAAVAELEIYRMNIRQEIEPGVPAMTAKTVLGDMRLVLKSGSFGSDAFLERAASAVRREDAGQWMRER